MKQIGLMMFCFLLAGCVMASEQKIVPMTGESQQLKDMLYNFISLRQIHDGMSSDEVKGILGDKVVVGYELIKENESARYRPLTANNPYRQEDFKVGAKQYHVEYYLMGIRNQDDKITDDELVPFVFQAGKLQGKGWDFFQKRIKNKSGS